MIEALATLKELGSSMKETWYQGSSVRKDGGGAYRLLRSTNM